MQVYEPAARPVAVVPVPPEGAQLYVSVPVPPLAVTFAVPLLLPLHNGLVLDTIDAVIAVGLVRVTIAVVEQPLPSVTVQVYEPADSPLADAFVPPEGVQL
jgi:hypothetical protein